MRSAAAVFAAGFMVAAVAGCSGGASPDSSPAASPPATDTATPTRSAWVRGTHVVLTNQFGKSLPIQSKTPEDSKWSPPAPLPNGSSVTAADEWASARFTAVYFRTLLSDMNVTLQFTNPVAGTPKFSYCDSKTPQEECGVWKFDEGQTRSFTMATGSGMRYGEITVTRAADEGDNKKWTAEITPLG